MIQIFDGAQTLGSNLLLDNMHRDRKHIFVDLLRWDVPVVDDAFERDTFDTAHAVYLVDATEDGEHLGSLRLLPTVRPHLLGALFSDLCTSGVPVGSDIMEITRGCLSPRLRAAQRLRIRNRLTTAAVLYALRDGLSGYTCIADSSWLGQIPRLGWTTRPLGTPRLVGGTATGALQIAIDDQTLERFKTVGTFEAVTLTEGAVTVPLAA